MQKKIIVVATAAALSLPAMALADTANVTVYGVANLSADYIRTGDATTVPLPATTPKSTNKVVVSSNQSRLGFKGTEDLGDGMSAVWQIESLINMDNAGGSLGFGRNTFAGLKFDAAGTILLGRYDTPYQMATRKLDVFMDGLADSRGVMGGGAAANAAGFAASKTPFDGRQPDSIMYLSPTWGGFNLALSRINTNEGAVADGAAESNITSLSGMFTSGPIYVSLAYETHDFKNAVVTTLPIPVTSGLSTKEKSAKVGFGFTHEVFLVNAVYEKSSDDFGGNSVVTAQCSAQALGTNCFGHTSVYVGGKVNVGNGAIKAAYAKAGKLGDFSVNTGARQVSVGYDHNLSKRTIAYAQYTKVSNDDNARYGLAANSSGGGAVNTTSGVGADPSALSFGVRHAF